MQIVDNCAVAIHYTLTDEAGETLDTSDGQEPLVYLHGTGEIVPGLEKELAGKVVGDTLNITVQPEDGYGIVNADLIESVPRSAFEGIDDIQPGMQFETRGDDSDGELITVIEVSQDNVTVDGNHPFAGHVLHFAVRVEDVRKATEDEVAHGHVHGPDCHH